MAIANLAVTSTFRTWYSTTNETIDRINNKTIGDLNSVFGVYTVNKAANTSVNLCNGFFINNAAIVVNTAMSIGANISVTSLSTSVVLTPNTITIQPLNGTLIQTPISINAASTFLKNITVTGNLALTGNVSVIGSSLFTGNTSVASGSLDVRQILYSQTGAVIANAISSPILDDFTPTGIASAEILNLTPSINAAITGIAAPSIGARLLHIQNLSPTYYLTLVSNTSSQTENRIVTPGSANTEVAPGGAITLLYTKTNNTWRVLAPTLSTASPFAANISMSGTLIVAGNTTFNSPINVTNTSISYISYLRTGTFLNDTLATFSAAAQFNGTLTADNPIVGSITGNANTASNVAASGIAAGTAGISITGSAGSVPAAGVAAGTANISILGSANTVTTAAQPNITSLGTLSSLTVTSAATFNGTTKMMSRFVLPVGSNFWATS